MRVNDDFISRKKLIDELIAWRDHDVYSKKRWFYEKWVRTVGINVLIMAVKNFPAADAVPVVHGWWIHDINNLYGCSVCGGREIMSPKKLKNYCPNCGAKMDKIKNM